ncbi:MAG: hypothetical protein K1060chlam4_00025 [Candidatus Anoxychlamydiales bacterium]|nr:hypothetical protein [Candidatus Anoxychlamydiales bacterium]
MAAVDLNNLLSSYDNFNSFMKGEKPISHLKSIGESKDLSKIEPFNNSNKIVIIAKLYLSIIKDVFLGIITKPFYLHKTSIYFQKAEISHKKIRLITRFGNQLLMPGTNRVAPNYINSSFDTRKIDSKIKSLQIVKDENKHLEILSPANFPNGLCMGMCGWFNFLYENTKLSFANKPIEDHLKAIASLFRDGAPIEGFLCHLHPGINKIKSSVYPLSHNIHVFARPLDVKKVKTFLKKIPLGFHHVSFNRHIINIIKASNDCTYIWDPNMGLIKIKDLNFEDAFFNYFEQLGRTYNIKDGFIIHSLEKDLQPNLNKAKKISPEIFIMKKSKNIESAYEYISKKSNLRRKIEFPAILTANFLKLFYNEFREKTVKEIFAKAYKKSDYLQILCENIILSRQALDLAFKTVV